jgi:integrase
MPKLTKQIIDATMPPATGELWIGDSELPSFGVRVHSGGRKVYMVRYRTNCPKRILRKLTIAPTNVMPPNEAREQARKALAKVAAGEDPAGDRARPRADAQAPTIEDLFKARVASMRAKGRVMATNVEYLLLNGKENAADALGRKTAPAAVTPADIVRFVSVFYKAGHRGQADKARSYLAATFSWAIKSANDYTVAERQDWGLTINPAAAVAKDQGAIGARERNLDADELRAFWLDTQGGQGGFSENVEVALRMVLTCGQRVQETLRVDGCEIDLEKAVWRMPAPKTKGKKAPHTIPLPAIILPDLRRLKAKYGDGPLFPAKHESSQSGILSHLAVAHALRRYVQAAGCPVHPFQPRDLRRTWKSRAHDAGVDRYTRDLIQQHAKSDTGSKHYDKADYLPQMTEAMVKWSKWLEAAVGPPPLALAA